MKKYKNDGSVKYKYTENINRDIWLREMYPLANMILSKVVSKIPWKKYRFEGSTLCQFTLFDENENESVEIKNIRGQAEFSEYRYPYSIIGGTACELYGKMFPEIGDIYEIVDATADIDIRINLPLFIPEIESETDFALVMNIGDSYTEFNDHFTNWLFNEIVKLLKKNRKYFEKSEFSLPDERSDYEISRADLLMDVGPLLVTRVLLSEKNMIKIQVSTQVNGISDHFIEFILPIEHLESFGRLEPFVIFDSLIVQDPLKLFYSQIDALINRHKEDIEIDEDKHKFYNHCARLIYLTELLIFLRKNNMIDKQPDNTNIILKKTKDFNKLCKGIFENYDLHSKIIRTLKILSSPNPNKVKMNKSDVLFKK